MTARRRSTSVLALAALLALAPLPAPAGAADLIVSTESGKLRGEVRDGVATFKGIPYAAPPVGRRRWLAPQPIAPWSGVRTASGYGNDCAQLPLRGDASASAAARSENCLVLNVWRPATIPAGQKLPVMFWIHGGGFLNGAASIPFLDGSEFARDGLVIVSFNYRLGRLGFFAHPALSATGERPLANFAFMDQLAALRWVRRNIGAFGGDTSQVTIFGESAGGIAVMQLLTWPAARGLFQRAAVMSGGGRSYLVQNRDLKSAKGALLSAEATGVAFAKSVGIVDTGAAGLRDLRALPVERVNGDMSMAALTALPPTYAGGPVTDGDVVTASPGQNLLKGNFATVPLIIGTTGDDVAGDYPLDRSRPLDFFGADSARARELYDTGGKLSAERHAMLLAVDRSMHEPARFVARQWTAKGVPAWIYRFDYVADSLQRSVAHAPNSSELGYLFDRLRARYGPKATPRDHAMARAFHEYFANFAKRGDPNGAGLPEWPRFDPAKSELMMFGGDGRAAMQPDPWGERLALVTRAIEGPPKPVAIAGLEGTSWQLIRFEGGDGRVLVAKDRKQYTLAFTAEGKVSARIACNRGHGTWTSDTPGSLALGPLALTRMACPPDSMVTRLTRDWKHVRSYVRKEGRLYLSLMADGGIYEFEPATKP